MRVQTFSLCAAGALLAAALALPADAELTEIQKLADRAEIEELVTRYVTALDTLDAETYAHVFAEDAEYEVAGTLHKGRAAIKKIVTDLAESRARNEAAGKKSPALYHVMANHSIEITSETTATHRSYAQTVRAGDDGRFVVGFMGRYDDVLVKRDGRWYISSRKLVSFVE
jgi:uncharacterized protein (TIGR02246 family)